MHAAVAKGHLELVKLFLDSEFRENGKKLSIEEKIEIASKAQDINLNTALHTAWSHVHPSFTFLNVLNNSTKEPLESCRVFA